MSDQGHPQDWTGFPVRRYGPSYEAGLFDKLDDNVPMEDDDDAATKASE